MRRSRTMIISSWKRFEKYSIKPTFPGDENFNHVVKLTKKIYSPSGKNFHFLDTYLIYNPKN